jgi:hypothetical protein
MERLTETTHILAPEYSAPARDAHAREYHVCFDGRHWNVTTAEGEMGPSSLDRDMAVTLAVRAARHDHADGADVTVCVEEQDGTFRVAWASA